MGGPERRLEDVCETEAGTEADADDVDVVGGMDEVGVSGYKSEVFTLSKILRRKTLSYRRVSEDVADTSHGPHCEFSNFQQLPSIFLFESLCWPVNQFH